MSDEFLEPWTWILDAEEGRSLAHALEKEVGPEHPLYGSATRGIVRSSLYDADVLYEMLDGSGRVAFVHLTWGGRQSDDWPFSVIYESLDLWRQKQMPEDHDEWLFVTRWICEARLPADRVGQSGRGVIEQLRTHDERTPATEYKFTLGGDREHGYRLWVTVAPYFYGLGKFGSEEEAVQDANARFGVLAEDWQQPLDSDQFGFDECSVEG